MKISVPSLARFSQSGASMMEAAIAVPLLFALVGVVLSVAQIMASRLVFDEALQTAARVTSVERGNCQSLGQAAFYKTLAGNWVSPHIESYTAQWESPENSLGGYRIKVNAKYTCVLCPFLTSISGSFSLSGESFLPREDGAEC